MVEVDVQYKSRFRIQLFGYWPLATGFWLFTAYQIRSFQTVNGQKLEAKSQRQWFLQFNAYIFPGRALTTPLNSKFRRIPAALPCAILL